MKVLSHLIPYCLTLLVSIIPTQLANAQTFSVLHTFTGSDGAFPLGGLVIGPGDALYGATESGGAGNGAVYSLIGNAAGVFTETVVYDFTGTAGQGPSGKLIDVNGTLIGTAPEGGTEGAGTVFQLTPGLNGAPSTEVTLYNFSAGTDGRGPFAGLTKSSTGALYGTTTYGGNASCTNGLGCGTVFQLLPPAVVGSPWTESVIYRFQLGVDGANPSAGVALASTGVLYGTTSSGGVFQSGAVFSLTPPAVAGGAWTEAVIYSFSAGIDGNEPLAGLAIGSTGNLFGSTLGGGEYGCGTLFELTPPAVAGGTWTKSTIHNFTCTDGAYPEAAVLIRNNILYGTTSGGGAYQGGTIFALLPPAAVGDPWTRITLHHFQPATDGAGSTAPLISGLYHALLGTAMSGGSAGQGTVFRLIP